MAPLGRLGSAAWRLGSSQGRALPSPFVDLPYALSRVKEGSVFPSCVSLGKRRQVRGRLGDPAWEGLRPLLPWSRRGGVPPRACLLVRGWQKFKLVKSGLVPRGGEKRPGSPSPSRAWRRLAQPQGRPRPPLARRGPTPGAAPRPLPGRRGGPELNERNSATLIGLGLDAAPRGRRSGEDGAQTCDPL